MMPILPSSLATARYAAGILVCLASHAFCQEARLDRSCTPPLSELQTRLLQKWAEGPDSLRNFVYIRRQILQLDIYETMSWAEAVSAAHAACLKSLEGPVEATRSQ